MSRFRGVAASAALGALLAAVAFGAAGGNDLSRSTVVQILLLLAAGAAVAIAVARRPAGPVHGGAALALLAAFAVVTALSAAWSIAPANSVQEAGRVFAYLAVFAAAVGTAHWRPRDAPVVAGGIAVAGVTVCAWALLTRVFPAQLADDPLLLGARLGEPFGYWNALGSMAATALPATLWLGARRGGRPVATALAYPATGVILLTLLLTQSRGALLAAALAALLWLAVVPLRLRTMALLLLPGAIVAPVAAWALSKDAFTGGGESLAGLEAVAGDFGLMAAAAIAACLVAGLALEAGWPPSPSLRVRRRAGIALAVAACALPLAAASAAAVSDRGLGGTISDRVDDLTQETSSTPGGAARLGSVSSARSQYWRQAKEVLEENPVVGRGADSFRLARLPYRRNQLVADHAHGFMAQALSDLGLLGGVIALALLAAWLAAAARSTGLTPRARRRPDWTSERGALVALALCAVAFGIQSTVDWTWSVHGPAVAALVAAGYVAGRRPLRAAGAGPEDPSRATPVAGLRHSPARAVAAGAVLVTAVLCALAVWQPERAARANDRALTLLEEGDTAAAIRQAAMARDIDPYSPEPLYVQALVFDADSRLQDAYRALERAVVEHPRDPDAWVRLGSYELDHLDLPGRAVETLEGALRVDPYSQRVPPLLERARAAVAGPGPG